MGVIKPYFFGATPLEGAEHLALQEVIFLDPKIDLSLYDYAIITSKNTLKSLETFSYDLSHLELYCVGEKTARLAKEMQLNVVYHSKGYAKDLISDIEAEIADKRGIYLRAKEVANSYITNRLEPAVLEEAICYETRCKEGVGQSIEHPALLFFAAPSQIRCFLNYFSFDKRDTIICIGRTTKAALPKGVEAHISPRPTFEAMFEKAADLLPF